MRRLDQPRQRLLEIRLAIADVRAQGDIDGVVVVAAHLSAPSNQNSNRLVSRRFEISPKTRCSSAGSLAAKVTLKRMYAPASSHGTLLINLSVIIHWLNDSAFSNAIRWPLFAVADFGART